MENIPIFNVPAMPNLKPVIPEKLDDIESTIEQLNQAIVKMGNSSEELSTAAVKSAKETEQLTRRIHVLTWVMAIASILSLMLLSYGLFLP
jgi:ABC-type transporter Mla subunit MlaD